MLNRTIYFFLSFVLAFALGACGNFNKSVSFSVPACDSSTGNDGEGCAFVTKSSVIAGTKDRFSLVYTAGKSGIPVGGGIALGFHHGAAWKPPSKRPWGANRMTVKRSDQVPIDFEFSYSVPENMFPGTLNSKYSNKTFHNLIIGKIKNKPLGPGETITFDFGANWRRYEIQKYQDADHEIRITTDIDGDQTFDRISETITFPILFGPAVQLSATAPSQAVKNEEISVLLRAEDSFYNVDENFNETISILDEHGNVLADQISITNGLTRTNIILNALGHHRLKLTNHRGETLGRSNPIRVFEEDPDYKIFWGDIHGHSGDSDGLAQNIDEYFKFGRDVAGLDILALTDHGSPDWESNINAVKTYHDPGKFVTILAQEMGKGPNHLNLYLRRDDADHIANWQSSYRDFQDWIEKQYNLETNEALIGPHHFAYKRAEGSTNSDYPFGYWNEKVARFVEVYSSHGTSEFVGNPRPLVSSLGESDPSKFMQHGLEKGLKFSVIGASDNHDSRPGRSIWGYYSNGLAAFQASKLSREAVWDALWNHKTYATSFDRIYMETSLNGRGMGTTQTINGPINIQAYIIGQTDNLTVSVLKNNEIIHTASTKNGLIELDYDEQPEPGDHFYYLRVEQDNGERAWSTPFWITQK